jgi:hypothetical protein
MFFAPFFGCIHFIAERFTIPRRAHVIVNMVHVACVFGWNPDFIMSKSYFLNDSLMLIKNRSHYANMFPLLFLHHAISLYILDYYRDDEDVALGLKWLEISNVSLAAHELLQTNETKIIRAIVYPWCRCIMFPMTLGNAIRHHGTKAFVLGMPLVAGSVWWSAKVILNLNAFRRERI